MKRSSLTIASATPSTRLSSLALCIRLALGISVTSTIFSPTAFAEGTKQYAPTASNYAALGVSETGSSNALTYPFAGYDQSADNRLYIHIADPANEVIYIGLGNMTGNAGDAKTANYYWRIKAPDGTIVKTASMAGGASSNIASHAQAIAGPDVLNPAGYSTAGNWTFDPAAAGKGPGDYYIEFDIDNNAGTVGTFTDTYNGTTYNWGGGLNINWFDITVATKGASPQAIDGRLWSKNWGVRTNDPAVFPTAPFGTPFNGRMYAYDNQNFVTKIDFNGSGLRPLQGQFSFNNTGTGTSGVKTTDRKSVMNANATTPLHKIFLNQPDPAIYPLGVDGQIQNLPLKASDPSNTGIQVEVTQPGQVDIVLDFGNDGSFTAGIDRRIQANVVAGVNQVPWDGKNGAGTTVAAAQFPIQTMIAYTQGETHFTAYDVEGLDNGFQVYTQTNSGITGPNLQFWDDSNITQPSGVTPTVLTNVDTGATTRQTWNYVSADYLTGYGNSNTVNTWWFAYRDYHTTVLRSYNDAPVATNDTASTNEDTVLNGTTVLVNDSDINGDTLTVNTTPTVAPSHGTLVLNANGTYTYTPNANFNGTDSFSYQISDGNGGTATATVTISVAPVNDPPLANDDSASTPEDTTLNGSTVLVNDTDIDGDTLTVNTTPISAPAHGTLTLNSNGTYIYTPTNGYNGADSFTYEISDGNGGTDTAVVNITVSAVNDAPVATDDAATTAEDTVLNGSTVLANDSDPEGNTLTVNTAPIAAPAHGTLALNANGTYTYTPNANFNGTDSFTYEISDGNGGKDTAVVTITVTPANDAPNALDDSASTAEDTALNGTTVLGNDTDLDGDTLSVNTTPVVAPTHGTLVLNADGTYTYTPNANFNGTDNFTYEISDGKGGMDTAVVTITVTPANDAPNALDDSSSTAEDSVLNGTTVLSNDTDEDGDTLSVNTTPVVTPVHGTLVLNANGTYTYTPDKDFNGTDSFTYEITDGKGGTDTAIVTLTVTPANDPPIAMDDTATTQEDTVLNGTTVLGNDTDGDGDTLTVNTTPVATPAHGTLVLKTDGTYTYTPDKDFNGTDNFTYEVSDGKGGTDTATVTLTIGVDNDAPLANDDTTSLAEDAVLNGSTVLVNDTDIDGDTLTVNTSPVAPPAHGTLVLKTDGTYTYTPDKDFNGTDSFSYEITDGNGGMDTATVTLTVTPINDAPVAQDDSSSTTEDTVLNGSTVLVNDTDLDGDTLSVNTTPVVAPAHGTLVLKTDGTYTYTPNTNFNGTDSFSYEITDSNGGTDTAVVTLTVSPANDAPDAVDDTASTSEDTVLNGTTVLSNDTDLDGDTLSITIPVAAPAHGMLELKTDGTYTYTPNKDFNGTDSFSYEITDGNGGKDIATVTITVTPINDAPIAQDDSGNTPEDTVLNGSTVLGNDTDVDGDTLTVNTTPVTAPSHGVLVLKADGTYTYTPDKDFNGTDSFGYEITDGNGGMDTAVVNLTISPVNDAPLITSTNNVTFAENGTGTALDVQSTDDNDQETSGLTYSLQPMFDAALFNIDPVTGEISFKAPPDYEAPQDSNGDNAYILMTKVCDSGNLCNEQVEVIVVTNIVESNPPVITATSMKVPENQTFVTTVSAADPDAGDTLTFSIKGGADANLFNIDPVTGVLSFKTAPDFETPTDATGDNVYEVIVSVTDNTAPDHTAEQALKVTVTNVQENTPPTITSDGAGDTANIAIAEEQLTVTTVQASDAEDDTLTYSISGGEDAALFEIDPATGKLMFLTAPDFENPGDVSGDNQYLVTVSVQDKAGTSDTQALTITVSDIPDVKLQVRGFLQGAYISKDGLMRDDLRTLELIPSAQPYGASGTPFAYTGAETAAMPLATIGNDAPVDWVLVELRDPTKPQTRINAMAGLLQRDGDVVDAKTGSPSLVMEHIPAGQYYVTLRHRNHLGVTTAAPLTLSSSPTAVDFTQTATATLGKDARLVSGSVALLWAGDANMSDTIIANGPSNDTNVVLGSVLTHSNNSQVNSNFRLKGYYATDLNLDGISLYSGPGNDINLLLGNVLLHPSNTTFAANYIMSGTIPK